VIHEYSNNCKEKTYEDILGVLVVGVVFVLEKGLLNVDIKHSNECCVRKSCHNIE